MDLKSRYEAYIACLNARDLEGLDEFVSDTVIHNGSTIGISGYREILAGDYRDIPDLHFAIERLISDASTVGSRLRFDCHPQAEFLGLRVDGRRVVFHENVFYRFADGKIQEVWSVIDKAAIERQLFGL
ncbi:MAG: ester cyclase [Salinicola sp.]|uniref:ester cyclase n=1 Tax=uncultured Salinicola sp. TaxID=1193542 RepID=UPI000C8CF3F8|nr:ester cyclase [uncultured Salinicola sp.]MAM55709.1 ester cyclase [Salinicola sp.]|tara:strand:- start:1002 stop:1388 length:387 start_codon:yes stop_codon:yes gene_type:complete